MMKDVEILLLLYLIPLDMDLRQFVYLDDLAVRSLLASMDIAPPQEIKAVDEAVSEVEGEGDIGGEASIPFIGGGEIGADISGSRTGREMLQTRKKITDQHIFNILYENIQEEVTVVSEEGVNAEPGEIIKIEGEVQTDAIYRVLKAVSLFSDVLEFEDQEEIQRAEELLYDKGIGISIAAEDSRFSYTGTLTPENLWIDQERAFLGNKQYTILGRVYNTFGSDESWDYIDLVKIADTIVADETMSDLRNVATQLIETLGEASEEYERPNLDDADIDNFSSLENLDRIPNSVQSTFELSIDEREIAVEGPGIVIDPIAIYW